MKTGFTYLIDYANKGNTEIELEKFAVAFKEGLESEPQNLGKLVQAMELNLGRSLPELAKERVRGRVLAQLAASALMIDKGYSQESGSLSSIESTPHIWQQYENPEEYGSAMKALVNYIAPHQQPLVEFLLD